MTFQYPYFFYGLLGLVLPVAIHLWSRRNPKIIFFGSIRFLPEGSASRTFSLSLTERLLLILRMMLISLMVMIMATPLRSVPPDFRFVVLVDPAVSQHEAVTMLADSIREEVRYLVPGFPVFDRENTPVQAAADAWTLTRAAAEKADCLLVVTGERMNNFSGRRPALDIPVHWVMVEPALRTSLDTLLAYQGTSGRPYLLTVSSGPEGTAIDRQTPEDPGVLPVEVTDTLQIVILADAEDESAATIRAATLSATEFLDLPVRIYGDTITLSRTADWLVLIDTLREYTLNAKNMLKLSPARPGPAILETDSAGVYILNGTLPSERALEQNFPAVWTSLLDPWNEESLRDTLRQSDQRRMVFDPSPSFISSGEQKRAGKRPWTWPFWISLFLILGTERYLAHRRHA